ncbi:unnamed protein product [Sphagnum tenellum]
MVHEGLRWEPCFLGCEMVQEMLNYLQHPDTEFDSQEMIFNPQYVEIFYDQQGHLGCGVVTFNTSEVAEAFDHSFKTVQFGQWEYIEVHWHGHLGTHLYGWHATELVSSSSCQIGLLLWEC